MDHSKVIFQKEKGGGGSTLKKSLVCKTPIDRNKNVTLNRCPYGSYE